MLGWIYVWKGELGLHKVKVRFGNLWYYLLIVSTTPLDYGGILRNRKIYKNTCSRQERWKELGEPDFSDYRDLDLYELARIIFLRAPEDERKEREAEWEGLGAYYRRRLPMKIDLNIFWYPNRFDILFPSLDLTINFWRRLSRRDHKRKPKNIVKWFKEATEVKDPGNYLCQPFGTYTVNLVALIWWLGDERGGVLLEEMFGEI
jgi:hypothetical protein